MGSSSSQIGAFEKPSTFYFFNHDEAVQGGEREILKAINSANLLQPLNLIMSLLETALVFNGTPNTYLSKSSAVNLVHTWLTQLNLIIVALGIGLEWSSKT